MSSTVEPAPARADVVAGPAVDLVEQLAALHRSAVGIADAPEQQRLAVVQREAVPRHHHARRVVPAVDADERPEVVVAAGEPAQVIDRALDAEAADLLREPAVERREADRIGRLPAVGAVRDRGGRVEHAGAQAGAPGAAGHGPEIDEGLGQADRVAVVVAPGRGVEVQRQRLADRLVEREAQAPERETRFAVAELAEPAVEERRRGVGDDRAQVHRHREVRRRRGARRRAGERRQRQHRHRPRARRGQ